MKVPDDKLFTPIYVKNQDEMPWPDEDKVFYTLGANGLFLCRNHRFFRSCVPAKNFPSELSEQDTFLQLRYPKVPRRVLELIVGFFDRIGKAHGSEAGVLLAWDQAAEKMEIIVPEQTATVSMSWRGQPFPIGLHYEVPTDLPKEWIVIGDVHSHVDEPAYASGTDKWDEKHRAGLHIVVGRLYREPPEFHLEGVVDGARFDVPSHLVFEGYKQRRTGVPDEWLDKVKVESYSSYRSSNSYSSSSSGGYGGGYSKKHDKDSDRGYGNGGYKDTSKDYDYKQKDYVAKETCGKWTGISSTTDSTTPASTPAVKEEPPRDEMVSSNEQVIEPIKSDSSVVEPAPPTETTTKETPDAQP